MPENNEEIEQKNITPARAEAREQKKQLFLKVLEDCRGVITSACHRSDIGRTTIYRWRQEDAEFAEAIDEIQKEFAPDMVESKLLELIEGVSVMIDEGLVYKQPPNFNAIKLFLESRAQHRGYGQRFQKPLVLVEEGAATGRPEEAKIATADSLFRINGDQLVSGADMFKAIEEVATADELNLLKHVIKRARESITKNGDATPLSPKQ